MKKRDESGNFVNVPLEDRFWEKVDRQDEDECWEWQGVTGSQGYGRIKINGSNELAHRVSYSLKIEDPEDQLVLHHCDNEPCVNPNHLYLGDQSDNMEDAYNRGKEPLRGTDNKNAKLTEKDVAEIRNRIDNGESKRSIAEDYPVSHGVIGGIGRRERWEHVEEQMEGDS